MRVCSNADELQKISAELKDWLLQRDLSYWEADAVLEETKHLLENHKMKP